MHHIQWLLVFFLVKKFLFNLVISGAQLNIEIMRLNATRVRIFKRNFVYIVNIANITSKI